MIRDAGDLTAPPSPLSQVDFLLDPSFSIRALICCTSAVHSTYYQLSTAKCPLSVHNFNLTFLQHSMLNLFQIPVPIFQCYRQMQLIRIIPPPTIADSTTKRHSRDPTRPPASYDPPTIRPRVLLCFRSSQVFNMTDYQIIQ